MRVMIPMQADATTAPARETPGPGPGRAAARTEPEKATRARAKMPKRAEFWYLWVAVTFLGSYLECARGAPFLPSSEEELRILLDAYLLEKAVYEVRYELNNRPDWVRVPAIGILRLLGKAAASQPHSEPQP